MVHSAGTEDEYGSCWGMGGAFTRPYCGYLPDGAERHLLYRWYLANPVRFQQSLKVEIQDIHDFGPGADDYTSLAFWYQEEPHEPFALQPFAERTAPSKAHEYKKSPDAFEESQQGIRPAQSAPSIPRRDQNHAMLRTFAGAVPVRDPQGKIQTSFRAECSTIFQTSMTATWPAYLTLLESGELARRACEATGIHSRLHIVSAGVSC